MNTPDVSEPTHPSQLTTDAIRAMRRSYGEIGLLESTILPNPLDQFSIWLAEAAANIVIVEANAMVLSTQNLHGSKSVDGFDGPTSRTVLLKEVSSSGFSFYTNYESAKARQIDANPQVSLLFPWYPMERQVIVQGTAEKVSQSVTDDYFATRPWGSQIGAWASSQSEELESRAKLEAEYAYFAALYPEGSTVPTPPHWGGFLVRPQSVEFWQGRYSRLHDRLRYSLVTDGWQISRLHP
jgi:pyridoxamine 5'-phosphate oxidase